MEGAEIAYQSPPASATSVLPHACSHLKLYRGSPTGHTPTQPRKMVPAQLVYSARKKWDFSTEQKHRGPLEWSNKENAVLVEFLLRPKTVPPGYSYSTWICGVIDYEDYR